MSDSVTVVIATRDRRESLLATLARLEALPERPPVVVVDNASGDGTPAAVRERHPGVRVLEAGENAGAHARTLGARVAATPHVAFSDDDSWWAPGALPRAAELLERHPRVALLAARILVEPGARLDPTCALMARSPLPGPPGLPGPPVLGFIACGAVMRRSAFLACGGFRPPFGIGGEETLLALDLAAAGWELAYVDELVSHHRPTPSPQRRFRSRTELRNELWITWMRRPLLAGARHTLRLLAQGRAGAPAALLAALRGLPWVVRERQALPPSVERSLRLLQATG